MRKLRPSIQKGFTLVELVIVLVVLGILSAIAIPRYVDLTGTANSVAAKASYDAVNTGFNTALANKAQTSPSNPFPTAAEVVANIAKATLNTAAGGICSGSGKLVELWTSATYSGAVSASTDVVRSVGASSTATGATSVSTTVCP
jgi:MSHA pilin protein MshA